MILMEGDRKGAYLPVKSRFSLDRMTGRKLRKEAWKEECHRREGDLKALHLALRNEPIGGHPELTARTSAFRYQKTRQDSTSSYMITSPYNVP